MERIQSINPERIAWCCADHGTTPGELASTVGISQATMERVLAGESGLTFSQLSKVASHFGRGALFFLEPGPVDEAQVHTAAFRTLANQKPELTTKLKLLIERVEKQREIYRSLREDLDDTDFPRFEEPDLPRANPAEAAQVARRWLGLGDHNTFENYRTALEARGWHAGPVRGSALRGDDSGIRGVCVCDGGPRQAGCVGGAAEAERSCVRCDTLRATRRTGGCGEDGGVLSGDGGKNRGHARAGEWNRESPKWNMKRACWNMKPACWNMERL